VRADYERVVRQRTALLKSARARGGAVPSALDAWDEQLVRAGAELTAGRLKLVEAIRPLVTAAYGQVSGEAEETSMSYRQPFNAGPSPQDSAAARPADRPAVPAGHADQAGARPAVDREELAAELRAALVGVRRSELDRGVCLVGPHRDELELRIGDLPARGYASHGESWSLALALRLAAYELLRSGGEDPVLLLDDVFAELDEGRRDRLAGLVAGAEQVLVTAAVTADVPDRLAGARFAVADGTVTRA
jgi:DNA replication and repair protein RecF